MRVFRPCVGSAGLCRGRKKSSGRWATECRQWVRQTLDPGLRRDDDFETLGLSEVIEYPRPLETQCVTEVIEYPRPHRDNRISGCAGGRRPQRRRPGAGRDPVLFVFYRAVCHLWGYITLWLASPKKQTHSRTAAPRKTVDRPPTDPPHRRPYPTLF